MRVLIDGDYARHRQGTGISSYARTLSMGLTALGHEVSWLSGVSGGDEKEPLADSAAIDDQPASPRGPRAWAQTTARMLGGLSSGAAFAREIQHRDLVVAAPSPSDGQKIHFAPELFVRAHYRHMLTRQFTEVRVRAPVDVFHLTTPLPVTMKGVKRVVSILDLIPIRLPYTTTDNKSEYIARVRKCANEADLIVTISEASKSDIVELLGVDPGKIAITYLPSNLAALSADESLRLPRSLDRFGLEQGKYLLFVGAQEPKKNLKRLIEAFLEVDTAYPLVIAGPRGWMWEQEVGAALAPLSDKARTRLKFTGYVDRDDLRRLYAGACAFLYPSLYEGFGLPVLEAMSAGTPVVTSNTSSLPEVCGDAALYVDPFNRDALRDAIEKVIGDADLRNRLSAAGRERSKLFSFDSYKAALAEAYSRLT